MKIERGAGETLAPHHQLDQILVHDLVLDDGRLLAHLSVPADAKVEPEEGKRGNDPDDCPPAVVEYREHVADEHEVEVEEVEVLEVVSAEPRQRRDVLTGPRGKRHDARPEVVLVEVETLGPRDRALLGAAREHADDVDTHERVEQPADSLVVLYRPVHRDAEELRDGRVAAWGEDGEAEAPERHLHERPAQGASLVPEERLVSRVLGRGIVGQVVVSLDERDDQPRHQRRPHRDLADCRREELVDGADGEELGAGPGGGGGRRDLAVDQRGRPSARCERGVSLRAEEPGAEADEQDESPVGPPADVPAGAFLGAMA